MSWPVTLLNVALLCNYRNNADIELDVVSYTFELLMTTLNEEFENTFIVFAACTVMFEFCIVTFAKYKAN